MSKIGKVVQRITRHRNDNAGRPAPADGGARPDPAAPALPRRPRRTPQQIQTLAATPPTLPPRTPRTAQQLQALAANAQAGPGGAVPPNPALVVQAPPVQTIRVTVRQGRQPDPVYINRAPVRPQTADGTSQTDPVPQPPPQIVYVPVVPVRPQMADASTQTDPVVPPAVPPTVPTNDFQTQTEPPKTSDALTQAGGTKLPRKQPVRLNTNVWQGVAAQLAEEARQREGFNQPANAGAGALEALRIMNSTNRQLHYASVEHMQAVGIERQLSSRTLDVSLGNLTALLGDPRATEQPRLDNTIRGLPAPLQSDALISLFRVAGRTSGRTMSEDTRNSLAPLLVQTLGDLPTAQANRILGDALMYVHDIDPAMTRQLLGQRDNPQAGTVLSLPPRDQVPHLEFLAANWNDTWQARAGLREIVQALPEGVGDELKARFGG